MKIVASFLLSMAVLFSLSSTAQYNDLAVYPKWFVESIPRHADGLDELRMQLNDPVPVKIINLSTGVKLEYIEQGNKDGIPVILLHGFPDSWRSYEEVLKHLPHSLHVFAISQRGHGNSDNPAKGYYPKDFAADIAAFIKAFNLPPAIIVGHSMGASITQQLVVKYPELVRGIVLEGAIASFSDKKDMVDYKGLIDQLKDPLDTALVRGFQQSTLANPIAEEYFNVLLQESLKVKAHVWKGVWQGLMTADYRAALRQVKKPALILWGEKDNFGPRADQEFFINAIEGSQLIEYKGTGHSLHWEQPKRFADDVAKFIESIK
jgi:non-heme chloroperoxidase